MFLESAFLDVRHALRGLRRSPLFALSVAGTIGLGLGVLCSAFTILYTYLLKPIDLPNAYQLQGLSWDTESTRRQRFTLAEFEELRQNAPQFSDLAAEEQAAVMHDGSQLAGLLVTGNYFHMLGARVALGRTFSPQDASSPGTGAVVVLSNLAWRSRFGADPAIVGKQIVLGRTRFDVVGVAEQGFAMPGADAVGFYAPLTMAGAIAAPDPWTDPSTRSLSVVGRLRDGATDTEARAWLDVWLRQRFPTRSELAPIAVNVESRGRRVILNPRSLTLLTLMISAFGLVLLVACANVTNLMLARALKRQREVAVRLSLGASRWRVARQLIVESLVLAVPASAVGLGLTLIVGRAFPALIVGTLPPSAAPPESVLLPLQPDVPVITLLAVAAVVSAVLVSLAPALRVTRANLVHASKGEAAMDAGRSRLRSALVAMQIGACVLFLIGATGFIESSQRAANPDTRLTYERVVSVRPAERIRADVAARLASDPSVDRVAATWRPPLVAPLAQIAVVASNTRLERTAGFMVVSPDYFSLFDIPIVKGRSFTTLEADESAPVVLVSEATARTLWPGQDPLGQTLDLRSLRGRTGRAPAQTNVRVIGVTKDVINGTFIEGLDGTCVYFPTGFRSPGEMSLLVRGRGDTAALKTTVTAAVNAIEKDSPFQMYSIREVVGVFAWMFQAFSAAASLVGVIGLVLAFSGTYAVVAFLVAQRTREFGVRMALGATARQIVSAMLGETMRIAAIGIAAGLAIAFALVRAFGSIIPIIPAYALGPYTIAVGIVLSATVAAALLPSLSVSRIDPSRALRVD